MSYRIAAASSDGKRVDLHFGWAERFFLYDVPDGEETPVFLECREVTRLCAGGHDAGRLQGIAEALSDCQYVFAERVGEWTAEALSDYGIEAMELPGDIVEGVKSLQNYLELQAIFSGFAAENENNRRKNT